MRARTLGVSIGCPPRSVYEFVSDPENLPEWAKSFVLSVKRTGVDDWKVQTTRGPAALRFVVRNNFGVLDHYVTLSPGTRIFVPMRVVANGEGSEVVFTLFQQPDVTDEDFAKETEMAEADLKNLKTVFEKTCAPVRP